MRNIFGIIIILCAVGAGILAGIDGEVNLYIFYAWLIVAIISRIHIMLRG